MENAFSQLDQLLMNLSRLTGCGFVWKRSCNFLSEKRLKHCNIHRAGFCENFKKQKGVLSCLHHDMMTLPEQLARNGKNAFEMICPAGALELVIPIEYQEHICGVILAGPFSPPGKTIPGLPEWKPENKMAMIQMLKHLITPLAGDLSRRNELINIKDGRIKTVLDYLDLHFQENPEIKFLADMVYLSVSRFSHLFRSECGVYLSAYINDLKLTEALNLLREGDSSIADVAVACGFSDPNHFSTSFKKRYGKTPRQIRREWHKKLYGQ